MQYFSKLDLDRFLLENFFYGKRDGVFVDVGTSETFSNTLFFERFLGWRGLCVVPNRSAFAKLAATRKAVCLQVGISDVEDADGFTETAPDDEILGRIKRFFAARRRRLPATDAASHPVTTLSSLLDKHGLNHVDYCSLDAGGAELKNSWRI